MPKHISCNYIGTLRPRYLLYSCIHPSWDSKLCGLKSSMNMGVSDSMGPRSGIGLNLVGCLQEGPPKKVPEFSETPQLTQRFRRILGGFLAFKHSLSCLCGSTDVNNPKRNNPAPYAIYFFPTHPHVRRRLCKRTSRPNVPRSQILRPITYTS